MSREDREKWNQRYASDSYRKNNPVTLLEDWLPKLPVGKALDVACGAGRNSIFLANASYKVDAIDISQQGLKRAQINAARQNLTINWIEHDFDQPFDFDNEYNLIVVLWYVNMELISRLCDCLAPGGFLLSEQHLVSDQPTIGPSTKNFRVQSNELQLAVSKLEILYYEELTQDNASGESVASARVVAKKARTS